jgi:hypothetical protein
MTQHKVPASVAKQSVVDVLVLCGPPLVAVGLLALLASKQPESWEVVFVLAVGLRCFLGASVSFAGGRLAAKLLRIGFSGSWLIGATVGYCASLLLLRGWSDLYNTVVMSFPLSYPVVVWPSWLARGRRAPEGASLASDTEAQ